ncbi:MAG: cystathionine beta-lyase [Beijerinckiaceae bacterium]|nr:cystathionine beta-lyase [Beijerinckiaceae bacterium]
MRKMTKSDRAKLVPSSRLVLSGRNADDSFGFVNPPIVRGSTVVYPKFEDFMARRSRFTYGTKGNPTLEALETALNDIEGGAGVVVVPSGLLACTLPLLACLNAGDHLLVTDSVYLPNRQFCEKMLKRLGIEVSYYDPLIGGGIASHFKANTRAVMTEAPGSQTFEMQDIPAIVAAAHARDIVVLMDNTWATPLYFDAHAFGVDYSIQAGTKYPAGHSDVLIGSISARTPEQFKLLRETWETLGVIVAPEDAFLTLRGLRTMTLRLAHQQQAGLEMAKWLQQRPEVARVLHPALPDDPGHAIWKRDFTGASSLFTIVLKPASRKALAAMLDEMTFFGMGASWGGYESLALPFEATNYRTVTKWQPEGPTIRLHIGLEDVSDLKKDLDEGFARLRTADA